MKLEAGAGISGAKQFYLADSLSSCPLQKGNINYEAIERQRDLFNRTNELLSARAFPYASKERFRICCDCLNLLWMIDESSDDQDGLGARKTGDIIINYLKDSEYKDDSSLAQLTKQ
ncbi:hypothetical protein V8E55_003626 [Tylopilus felleus]